MNAGLWMLLAVVVLVVWLGRRMKKPAEERWKSDFRVGVFVLLGAIVVLLGIIVLGGIAGVGLGILGM